MLGLSNLITYKRTAYTEKLGSPSPHCASATPFSQELFATYSVRLMSVRFNLVAPSFKDHLCLAIFEVTAMTRQSLHS